MTRKCNICNKIIEDKRCDAITCSANCRKRLSRRRARVKRRLQEYYEKINMLIVESERADKDFNLFVLDELKQFISDVEELAKRDGGDGHAYDENEENYTPKFAHLLQGAAK